MTEIAWPAIQPASTIGSWEAWPADVQPVLRLWNKQRWKDGEWRLTFASARGVTYRPRVFKCWRCDLFHESPRYGVAIFEGHAHCDGCMIDLARGADA